MGALIVGFAGMLLLGVGYLIGARHRLDLLAGYRPERVHDKDALAQWAGRGLTRLGVWTLVAAGGLAIRPASGAFIVALWGAGLVLGTIVLVLGSRRYSS